MLALAVATAAIIVAAVVLALYLTPRGAVAYLLAAGLLAEAMTVVTLGVAGLAVRSLAPTTLLLLALAWPAVAVIVVRLRGGPSRWRERAGAGFAAARGALTSPVVLVAFLLVAATIAWRVFLVVRLPVVDYDGWSYHLVFLDVWIQHDALVAVPQRQWTAGYPAVGELLQAWFAAFTRTDGLVGLVSVLAIPLALLGTVGLARHLGAERRWAVMAGLLAVMTPALVAQVGTSYVDIVSLASVLASWWLGLRVLRGERDGSAALLLGVAGGLALGMKGTNLVLVTPILGVAGLVLLGDAFARRRSGIRWSRVAVPIVALAVPVLVFGASWYLKNLVVYANPLYPFAIGPLAGPTDPAAMSWAPPGLERYTEAEQVLRSWVADWGLSRYTYNIRPGGLGRAWIPVLLLGLAGLVVLVRRRSWAALALVVLPAAIALATTPNPWYARYTLYLPALALALGAVVLTILGRRRALLATAAAWLLLGLAALSLVIANARPNIDLRPVYDRPASVPQYLAYLLEPDDARRLNVGLRAQCAGFSVIPPGARVAPAGFNLLHGVAGPGLDRILTDPIPAQDSPAALVAAMRERNADWLVTQADGRNDVQAAGSDELVAHGEVCQGGRLWQMRPSP